jgi:hypothetical protein
MNDGAILGKDASAKFAHERLEIRERRAVGLSRKRAGQPDARALQRAKINHMPTPRLSLLRAKLLPLLLRDPVDELVVDVVRIAMRLAPERDLGGAPVDHPGGSIMERQICSTSMCLVTAGLSAG